MRIAFVNATHSWGGVKTWMIDFGQQLQILGHTLRVYGRQKAFVETAQKRIGHGEVCSFGTDFNPITIWQFVQRFRREKIELVVLNVGKDLATAGIAAKILGIPVIQHIGLPEDITYSKKREWLHSLVQPQFFSTCDFIADGFKCSLPYLDSYTHHMVLNAKTASTNPLANHSPRRFVTTQQLNPDKDHATLLHAFAKVQGNAELHIVGTGTAEPKLKELTTELGIDDRVIWHGFTTDVYGLLKTMDIFLLASLAEGLPNTQLEAMAHGLLPIMREVGGIREVTTPELNEWILPAEAGAPEFTALIEKALALSDEELLRLREAARTACKDLFDLEKKTQELAELFARIIAEKK